MAETLQLNLDRFSRTLCIGDVIASGEYNYLAFEYIIRFTNAGFNYIVLSPIWNVDPATFQLPYRGSWQSFNSARLLVLPMHMLPAEMRETALRLDERYHITRDPVGFVIGRQGHD